MIYLYLNLHNNLFSVFMKIHKLIYVLFLCLLASGISAQVTFVVQSLPSYTPPADTLFIAGDFNGWQPKSLQHKLSKNEDGKWAVTLPAQAEQTKINFKFTRGSWATVEKGASGQEIGNRSFTFGNNKTVDIAIANWADGGGGGASTAASNVKILSTDFSMPQFNRTRRIWIYLPPDYETSGIRYPVLYMHDGQNLFDVRTAYSGEWSVDETLNTLAASGKRVPIVVGVDNGGGNRIGEYTPWKNTQYGGGDGEKYMQFIVETLKPHIDKIFRTLPDRENTGIMGSSLGGLISHYGALKYQSVFSKAGLFSPAYWFSDSIWEFVRNNGKQHNMKIFQLCGSNESSSMVSNMQRMNDVLAENGFNKDMVFNKVVQGGQHNEALWRSSFGEAYLWLFDSYITAVNNLEKTQGMTCFPNPVTDILTIISDGRIIFDSVSVIDMKGQVVKTFPVPADNKINVQELAPGTYLMRCLQGKNKTDVKFIKK